MYKLAQVFEGWDGYQTSLLHAVQPLTAEQLSWRPAPDRRSLGELVRHTSLGRINWFSRMGAPGIDKIAQRIPRWFTDADGARHVVEESLPCDQPALLAEWLGLSWQPIRRMLQEWTVEDLFQTYPHRFSRHRLFGIAPMDHLENPVPRHAPRRTTGNDARDAGNRSL